MANVRQSSPAVQCTFVSDVYMTACVIGIDQSTVHSLVLNLQYSIFSIQMFCNCIRPAVAVLTGMLACVYVLGLCCESGRQNAHCTKDAITILFKYSTSWSDSSEPHGGHALGSQALVLSLHRGCFSQPALLSSQLHAEEHPSITMAPCQANSPL